MSRTLPVVALALAHLWVSVAAIAAEKLSTFAILPATDELQVRFASSGCFHSTIHEFTFRHGATSTVAVASVKAAWSDAKPKDREELGRVTLSDADLKGLDELFRFYRSNPRGGCTTIDRITISQIRNRKPIATEEFTDGSCSTYQMKGVTTLSEIVRRLEKRK